MRRLLSAILLPLFLAGSLAACGGGGKTESTGDKAAAGASATPTASATEVADSPAETKAPDGKGLCGFLKSENPKMKAIGTPVGALAHLAIELATWVGNHPDQKPDDSMAMDESTKRDCPDVRNAALKILDAKTFQEALG